MMNRDGADETDPTPTTPWEQIFVSHCQYEVSTGPDTSAMAIYTLGDSLIHLGGPHRLTGFCGEHTGWVQVRARVLAEPPAQVEAGWDAISEATLWCPDAAFSVIGLMGDGTPALTDAACPRGLVRVRIHARNRIEEGCRSDADPPEQHELHIWSVPEETPFRTVQAPADPSASWEQRPAEAVRWAMLSLIPARPELDPFGGNLGALVGDEAVDDDADLPRVDLVRHRPGPVDVRPGVLPVGDLEIRLERSGDDSLRWTWATAPQPLFDPPQTTLPDDVPSSVRLTTSPAGSTLRHCGVLGRHATALGVIWDHLLDHPHAHPWLEDLRSQAAEVAENAELERRRHAELEEQEWGGPPPPDYIRDLSCDALGLARTDRSLLDGIDALSATRQWEVARWAARRAMRAAGLEQIGWIADALEAADAGGPLPEAVTDQSMAFDRLLSDPDVPHTTILLDHGEGLPEGVEILQQAVALPALLALASDNSLAAAINAVHTTARAHGADAPQFLADAHRAVET